MKKSIFPLLITITILVSGCIQTGQIPAELGGGFGIEIPETYYGVVDGIDLGYQITPHGVGLETREDFYSYFKTGNQTKLKRALFLTEYLISNATFRRNGSIVVWEYPFAWPGFNLSKYWTGSLAQANCLKVFRLAYKATKDERYLEWANKTLLAFNVSISEGGLKAIRWDGNMSYWWYPEYAKESPPFVLNGFVTAIIWIKEYYDATKNPLASELYEEGLKSLIHYLPQYDAVNWSYYDSLGHRSTGHYHNIHVKQMDELYNLTKNPIFLEYYKRWKFYN